jgi:pimeloyl-ACP methyl ester carboxylesterase
VPFCREIADRIVSVIQRAEKAVLPIAGHFMMLERPEGVNQVLLDFFRRH